MAEFTDDEMARLAANPNVESISRTKIHFTAEFKLRVWEEKNQGKRVRDILRANGIDPEVLGFKRIENFTHRLNDDMRRRTEFVDQRIYNGRPKTNPDVESMALEDRVRWLTHELEYAKQEVEFLKKLQMANMEARKEWESKHQHG